MREQDRGRKRKKDGGNDDRAGGRDRGIELQGGRPRGRQRCMERGTGMVITPV